MARLHSTGYSRDLASFQRLGAQRAGALLASLAVRALFPHHHALRAETLRAARAAASVEAVAGVGRVAEGPAAAAARLSRPAA